MSDETIETTEPTAEPNEVAAETAPATTPAPAEEQTANLDFLLDVPVRLTAELGGCQMTMQELLDMDLGSVVQLDKPANANVDVYVNQKLVARGEVVVAEENFGIRIKEVLSKPEA